jgi:oxygen-independent coproporphyrinogen-3 oxidase
MDAYVQRVCGEIAATRERVAGLVKMAETAEFLSRADSVYLGGGTPSLLGAEQLRRLFAALRAEFEITKDAEVTLECAPGQLRDETLEEMLRQGMNRVSFGVQSFVDREAAAVGRLHTRKMCLSEIGRLRAAGVENINVDLIAGLPWQTAASWRESVEIAIESEAPHVSVYMLEVDEESRLGREMLSAGNSHPSEPRPLAGDPDREQGTVTPASQDRSPGTPTGNRLKYGASEVPSEDEIADWYGAACEWLEAAGVKQYEISNFAREGHASRHNMKYWRREPYVGYGLDAHSMLRTGEGAAVRWANPDDLERYEVVHKSRFEVRGSRLEGRTAGLALLDEGAGPDIELVGKEKAFEEAMFLGLRMNVGVDLEALRAEFGEGLVRGATDAMEDAEEAGVAERDGSWLRLTARGRMASNEVFSRLLVGAVCDEQYNSRSKGNGNGQCGDSSPSRCSGSE